MQAGGILAVVSFDNPAGTTLILRAPTGIWAIDFPHSSGAFWQVSAVPQLIEQASSTKLGETHQLEQLGPQA